MDGRPVGRGVLSVVLAFAMVIALPGIAVATGSLGGRITVSGAVSGISGARILAYEATSEKNFETRAIGMSTSPFGEYGPTGVTDFGLGTYSVRVIRPGYVTLDDTSGFAIGPGTTRDYALKTDPILTERVADTDRFSTAVKVARERFTSPQNPQGWFGVDRIIIASGEDYAAADPLAAAGLCGAYGEVPLFLVGKNSVPASVRQAVKEISANNYTTIVTIVGGPNSVPDARFTELQSVAPFDLKKDRIISSGDRFDLAAAIAQRVSASTLGGARTALVANGGDPEKFFDALALSTVAGAKGYPILLVNENSVPSATLSALDQLGGGKDIFIGGGPATVSNGVMQTLDARYGTVERWSGQDRYKTAIAVADSAIAKGFLREDLVGVAAKLPDALTGGATVGQTKGALLITDGQSLTGSTGSWLAGHKGTIDKCYVIGGPASVTNGVKDAVNSKLQ